MALLTNLQSRFLGGGRRVTYLLRDEFTTARAAGAVNATAAEPGPGTRTVVDTESKLTIATGDLVFAGGKATPAYNDPLLHFGTITRAAGQMFGVRLTLLSDAHSGKNCIVGLGAAITGTPAGGVVYIQSGALNLRATATTYLTTVDLNAEYTFVVVLRAAGAFLFIRGGQWREWTLLGMESQTTTATLYAQINNYSQVMRARWARLPESVWLPAPLVSDSFNRANGALGSTDGAGHAEANGGGGKAWTANVGTWAITDTVHARATVLDGGAAIATVDAGAADVIHQAHLNARAGGNVGLVVRYVDASNYVVAYHDGTNVKLDKVVAGVTTNVATVATTYTAGRRMQVIANGTAFVLTYPNETSVGSTVYTIADAALQTGTRVGLYMTDIGNSFDWMTTYAARSTAYDTALGQAFASDPVVSIFNAGDSKTGGDAWRLLLVESMAKSTGKMFCQHPNDFGVSGATADTLATYVAANLAAVTRTADIITLNIGANDVSSMPTEAAWKADVIAMIDAFRAKWATCRIYIARPWRRNYLAECNTLAGWIAAIVATYPSGVHLGMDERVWMPAGDDGATMTTDGTHYSTAGQTAAAAAWAAVISQA